MDQSATPVRPQTLGALRAGGYRPRSVKQELRANLLARLAADRPVFTGIVGYGHSVIPAVENAIIAGQDFVLLGERGQAKTRLARSLVTLLDDVIPVVRGSELNEDPFAPILETTRELIAAEGDDTPIDWLPRDRRYGEKLATPDITIADLIGEVDPIKVAEGRYLSDASTIAFGLIPRTNRGIFTLNELPDLAERIQVGLLNVLEERDVQVRGYTLRLPLDLFVVASANPEDYTSRGRIITPLKDRLGSQIRTHYPRTIEREMLDHGARRRRRFDDADLVVDEPAFMLEIVAELSHLARRASEVSQRSGVSVRVSISNLETLLGERHATRRSRLGETAAAPRISDLGAHHPVDHRQGGARVARRRGRPRSASSTASWRGPSTTSSRAAWTIDSLARGRRGVRIGARHRDRRVGAVARLRPLDARDAGHARGGRRGWGSASHRPRSRPRSSSCWRGCTSTGGSTRTGRRPAGCTGADRA